MQFKDPGFDGYSRSQPVIQTYDRVQAAFPGGAVPALTVIKAKDVTAAPVQAAIQQLHDQALATGQLSEPSARRHQPRQDRRRRRPLGQGQRHRRRLRALARGPALRGRPRHGRQAGRRRSRRDRHHRGLEGLHRRHDVAPADRVRLRAQPRVHPAAGHVPLDRGPDQGDRPQPALGRLGLRRPRARLPGRPRREAAELRVRRRHRPLDPAVPVRDPLRPLDGLPRASSSAASAKRWTAA